MPTPIGEMRSSSGLFQQTEETWNELSAPLGLNDFSNPLNQRLAAVAQLNRPIILDDQKVRPLKALRNGDFGMALEAAGTQWSALPSGSQPR